MIARRLNVVAILLVAALAAPALAEEFKFHEDFVLGTSMDLSVQASSSAQAQAFKQSVLSEFERLSASLNTWDPKSEISRLNMASPLKVSPELIEVLVAAQQWQMRSKGAFNVQVGGMVALWKQAEKDGKAPDEAQLAALAKKIAMPGWRASSSDSTVVRLNDQPLTVDAIAKGYMIDRAMFKARSANRMVTGAMLEIGGDMMVFGNGSTQPGSPWKIGIADPAHPQDNAAPLTQVALTNKGLATSGNYNRFYTVGGKKYSHILDARTGKPAEQAAQVTVISSGCAMADALATILSVLPPSDGLALAASIPGTECLIVMPDGKQHKSPGWSNFATGGSSTSSGSTELASRGSGSKDKGSGSGKGFSVEVAMTVQKIAKAKAKPYIIVWVEDSKGQPVRTLAIWGNEAKYMKEMTKFWAFAKNDWDHLSGISRATRGPGQYNLSWDGLDERGRKCSPGTYVIRFESAGEKVGHHNMSVSIDCTKSATAKGSDVGDVKEAVVTSKSEG